MFFKIEGWNFQVQFEIKICETSQLSILKNKKVLLLKKIFFSQYQNKKALFTDSIFQKVLTTASDFDDTTKLPLLQQQQLMYKA